MAFTSDQPHVGGQEETQLASYRTISVAAILSLVFGATSALALAHWLLWVLPLVAIVLALVALRQIQAEDSNLTGRNLAILGILLALVFGVWAPSRLISRQNHLYRTARQYSDEWLELIRIGKVQEAHQLTLHETQRQAPGGSLASYYEARQDDKDALKGFLDRKVTKKLIALGDKATYTYAGGGGVPAPQFSVQTVRVNYVARWNENGKEREMPITVVLQRNLDEKTKDFLWNIDGVAEPSP